MKMQMNSKMGSPDSNRELTFDLLLEMASPLVIHISSRDRPRGMVSRNQGLSGRGFDINPHRLLFENCAMIVLKVAGFARFGLERG